jgi:hypothetical protein
MNEMVWTMIRKLTQIYNLKALRVQKTKCFPLSKIILHKKLQGKKLTIQLLDFFMRFLLFSANKFFIKKIKCKKEN